MSKSLWLILIIQVKWHIPCKQIKFHMYVGMSDMTKMLVKISQSKHAYLGLMKRTWLVIMEWL
jgi:hypothetical protein